MRFFIEGVNRMPLNEQDSKTLRLHKIITILQERNGSSVRDLARELGVSEMTIRRDFEYLSHTNAIKRVHGAVIYNPDFSPSESAETEDISLLRQGQPLQAHRFGAALAELIEPQDTILIDCGELAADMAQALPPNLEYDIYTYSTAVLERASSCGNLGQLFFIGGTFHPDRSMCESDLSSSILRQFRFSKVFLFPDGIHSEFGITCANLYEVPSKKAALASSLKTILVADSDRFETVSKNYIADLRSVSMVVTDRGLSGFWKTHLRNMGIDILYV